MAHVLEEETQHGVDSVSLCQSGIHIVRWSWYVSFAAPNFCASPNDPGAGAHPVWVDCSITDKQYLKISQEGRSECIGVGMGSDMEP